jgi:hypothetical protein
MLRSCQNEDSDLAEFRVVDLRLPVVLPEHFVDAKSPEQASEVALGIRGVRSGKPSNLLCRVYWQESGGTNMVRLYILTAHSDGEGR